MNDASASDPAKGKLAIAVRDFAPKMSHKYQRLLALREGIGELRRKGASYRTIVDILHTIDVPVSHSTLARFCRDVLVSPPARKESRHASVPALSQKSRRRPQSANVGDRAVERTSATGGPRIADPNSI